MARLSPAKGQERRTLKVGDSVHIPWHRSPQSEPDGQAGALELNIWDKDKPGLELVND